MEQKSRVHVALAIKTSSAQTSDQIITDAVRISCTLADSEPPQIVLKPYLVCRDEVNENGVQQLLGYSITLHYDGAHQVKHVHLHLLVMAVTGKKKKEEEEIIWYVAINLIKPSFTSQ